MRAVGPGEPLICREPLFIVVAEAEDKPATAAGLLRALLMKAPAALAERHPHGRQGARRPRCRSR